MLTTFIHFQANYDYRGKLMINEDSNKGAYAESLGVLHSAPLTLSLSQSIQEKFVKLSLL